MRLTFEPVRSRQPGLSSLLLKTCHLPFREHNTHIIMHLAFKFRLCSGSKSRTPRYSPGKAFIWSRTASATIMDVHSLLEAQPRPNKLDEQEASALWWTCVSQHKWGLIAKETSKSNHKHNTWYYLNSILRNSVKVPHSDEGGSCHTIVGRFITRMPMVSKFWRTFPTPSVTKIMLCFVHSAFSCDQDPSG